MQDFRREPGFWILSAWLVLVFLLGGSSRSDVPWLAILRAASVLVLGYGLATLTAADVRRHRFLLGFAAALAVLPLLQLMPLPPDIWRALPGRDVIAGIDREAGLGAVWRPLSMAPHASRNAFWALLAPLAALVLGVQLDLRQRLRLVAVVLLAGLASALLGLLQIVGDPQGPLYFYRYTFHGLPVGLFANRNHQAVFLACLLPMLAVWVRGRPMERRKRRAWLRWPAHWPLLAGAALILPLILVTGSRSGVLLSLVALLSLPLLHWTGRPERHGAARSEIRPGGNSGAGLIILGLGLALLAAATIHLGRGLAFDRLMAGDAADDMRVLILPTVIHMVWTYLPWGTGLGSFEDVYRLHESDALLRPFYMNHAHDDWLEFALTGGVPAILLLALAVAAFAMRATRAMRRGAERSGSLRLVRLGLAVLLVLGLASFTDYPLRTPSLACLAAIAALWACTELSAREGRSPRAEPGGVDMARPSDPQPARGARFAPRGIPSPNAGAARLLRALRERARRLDCNRCIAS